MHCLYYSCTETTYPAVDIHLELNKFDYKYYCSVEAKVSFVNTTKLLENYRTRNKSGTNKNCIIFTSSRAQFTKLLTQSNTACLYLCLNSVNENGEKFCQIKAVNLFN